MLDIPKTALLLNQIDVLRDANYSTAECVEHLIRIGAHAAPINEADFNATSYCEIAATLGAINPSLALSFTMHLYTVWGLYRHQNSVVRPALKAIVQQAALTASPNAPGLYFTAPGQLDLNTYPIRARKVEGGYIVDGIKKFVSLEPFVSFLPVYCALEGYQGDDLGLVCLMLRKSSEGVRVLEDWNTVAMQATASNSVAFEGVFCPDDMVICDERTPIASLALQGYLFRFSVSSVYLGIARHVMQHTIGSASSKRPPGSSLPLSRYPGVQFSTAEIIISLDTMEAQMERFAKVLDGFMSGDPEAADIISRTSLVAKEVVARESEKIVSAAMKIDGISSLSAANPLSRIYTDAKAAQFHPPQRDVACELLAKEALGVISFKNRWL